MWEWKKMKFSISNRFLEDFDGFIFRTSFKFWSILMLTTFLDGLDFIYFKIDSNYFSFRLISSCNDVLGFPNVSYIFNLDLWSILQLHDEHWDSLWPYLNQIYICFQVKDFMTTEYSKNPKLYNLKIPKNNSYLL